MLYGRLRLGPGAKAITLERRVRKGRWVTIARFNLPGNGAFARSFDHRRSAIYRLTFPGQPGVRKRGLAVRPVRRSG
jgi:hypothetical protein